MNGKRGLAGWCGATLLVSAFLLFLVQPMISKMILPWFGGSPSVWTTCMLFFQVFLLAGYTYAHLLDQIPRPRVQGLIHLALLIAALCLLPITPQAGWKPTTDSQPQLRILALLVLSVGLPYFLLAASAPLVQAWYRHALEGRSPYRFYALSNVGSLVALFAFPFLIEPALATPDQGALWSWGFGAFAALGGGLAVAMIRWDPGPAETAGAPRAGGEWGKAGPTDVPPVAASKFGKSYGPSLLQYVRWLLLPALGCTALLAVTNHICQDVAVVPFLWIAPLALYLLTFIICFDSPRWYLRRTLAVATIMAIGGVGVILLGSEITPLLGRLHIQYAIPEFLDSLTMEVAWYLAVLFLVCMLCHGELVRSKPEPRYLTSFYLLIAAGGALGGAFVAVACPLLFATYIESNLVLVCGFLLALAILIHGSWTAVSRLSRWLGLGLSIGLSAGMGVLVVLWARSYAAEQDYGYELLAARRNFYGVLSVEQRGDEVDDDDARLLLYNGRILHGVQFLQPYRRDEATTYYSQDSGVDLALINTTQVGALRVGVVGLGSGTLATYGLAGDVYRFYEINPDVVELCREYFTFIADSQATVEIVLGDARLSMERELQEGRAQEYDVLALDAFSGDAIPAHLLTIEAFAVYLRQIRSDGVIAVHTSNRHLDLNPIVALIADHYHLHVVKIDAEDAGGVGDSLSEWLLVTRNEAFLNSAAIEEVAETVDLPGPEIRVWTDQYSNLFQILQ